MTDDHTNIENRIHALQHQFTAGLPARLRQIKEAGKNWLDAQTPSSNSDFQVLVHNLAGAAGSYGFAEITALCQQIEDAILENNPASKKIIHARLEQLQTFI